MATWYQLSAILFVTGYNGTEISNLKENNISLTKRASVAAMVAGSFYHDTTGNRLYLSTSTGTNPNTSGTYIAYAWLGFCNKHPEGGFCDFLIQGNAASYNYQPALNTEAMPAISAGVTGLYQQVVTAQLGSISFINVAWWYTAINNYVFHNSKVVVKIGKGTDAYGDYTTTFTGILTNPVFTDSGVSYQVVDTFDREIGIVPPDTIDTTSWPNRPETNDGYPSPVLLGRKNGIVPLLVDETTFTYLVSQTTFSGVTYNLEAVIDVYSDGAALTLTTDYTVDLTAGTFTLVADPGDAVITCDAKGLKIEYDFTGGGFASTYSDNISEITFFILHILNDTELASFDLTSFNTLKSSNSSDCGVLLNTFIETWDLLKQLQPSGGFHLLTDLDGKFIVPPMSVSTAATVSLSHDDFQNFRYSEDTQNVRRRVIVNYNVDLSTGKYRQQSTTRASVGHKFQNNAEVEFNTIILTEESARDASESLSDFFGGPAQCVEGCIYDGRGFDYLPLDKLTIQRTVTDDIGNDVEQIAENSYFITQIRKSMSAGTVWIRAQKDTAQVAGGYLLQENGDRLLQENGDALLT